MHDICGFSEPGIHHAAQQQRAQPRPHAAWQRCFQKTALGQREEDVSHHQGEVAARAVTVGERGQSAFDQTMQRGPSPASLGAVDDVVMDEDKSV